MAKKAVAPVNPRWPLGLVLGYAGLILLSVLGLHGFMVAHAGTAGGHLFGSALNAWATPYFTRADIVVSDGTFQVYNHHPPLFFMLQGLLLGGIESVGWRLQLAYGLSASITAGTLLLLYKRLQAWGFTREVAALASVGVLGSYMMGTYRGFITFDVLSPLLGILLMDAMIRVLKHNTRINQWRYIGVAAFGLLVSYYTVAIVAVFLGGLVLRALKQKGWRGLFTFWPNGAAVGLAAFTCMMVGMLLLQEYLATGTLTSFQASLGNQSSINTAQGSVFATCMMLVRRVLESLPLLPLGVAAGLSIMWVVLGKQDIITTAASRLVYHHRAVGIAGVAVVGGVALFVGLTPNWSKVHPFAFLWLVGPWALLLAMALTWVQQVQAANVLRRMMAASCILGALLFLGYGTWRDAVNSHETTPLVQAVDALPITLPLVYQGKALQCGGITGGNILHLGAYPRHWLVKPMQPVPANLPPHIRIVCLSDTRGLLVVYPSENKTVLRAITYPAEAVP